MYLIVVSDTYFKALGSSSLYNSMILAPHYSIFTPLNTSVKYSVPLIAGFGSSLSRILLSLLILSRFA